MHNVLQCVAVCCSVLRRVFKCVAVCCSVLQCVAVCCGAYTCVSMNAYMYALHVCICGYTRVRICGCGVATMSRLLKMIGLFGRIESLCGYSYRQVYHNMSSGVSTKRLQKRLYSAKETYHFKEPTHRNHPISTNVCRQVYPQMHTRISCVGVWSTAVSRNA